MCTYIFYHDPDSNQPFIMASTRDERLDRKTLLPHEVHWENNQTYYRELVKNVKNVPGSRLHLNFAQSKEMPVEGSFDWDLEAYTEAGIQGPQDVDSGGMFSGINRHGVVAAMNNLEINSLDGHKLARSGLVLDALTFSSAKEAAERLYEVLQHVQKDGIQRGTHFYRYPAFNLIIADKEHAYVLQSGPIGILPDEDLAILTPKAGKLRSKDSTSGLEKRISVIGEVDGHHRAIKLEEIPPKQLTMVCGWSPNDHERSARTKKFLPRFEKLSTQIGLPNIERPGSWSAWLNQMRETRVFGGFNGSIAQPAYHEFDRALTGKKNTWGTVSTSLFGIRKGADDTQGSHPTAEMYYFPTPPTLDYRMECEHIKSTDTNTTWKNLLSSELPRFLRFEWKFPDGQDEQTAKKAKCHVVPIKDMPQCYKPLRDTIYTISEREYDNPERGYDAPPRKESDSHNKADGGTITEDPKPDLNKTTSTIATDATVPDQAVIPEKVQKTTPAKTQLPPGDAGGK